MTKINRFITSRISKSIERSTFYWDLYVDLRSERDKSVYFRSWGCYLLYNEIITKPEDHWSCIAHLSAEDMLKSAVIEEKKLKHSF